MNRRLRPDQPGVVEGMFVIVPAGLDKRQLRRWVRRTANRHRALRRQLVAQGWGTR